MLTFKEYYNIILLEREVNKNMKLKGKKKLNKIISAQLAPFGISKARLSDTFAYHFDKQKIDFKISLDIEDAFFSVFIKERFNYDDKGNEFVISLLHEVGHHLANEEINGDRKSTRLNSSH